MRRAAILAVIQEGEVELGRGSTLGRLRLEPNLEPRPLESELDRARLFSIYLILWWVQGDSNPRPAD